MIVVLEGGDQAGKKTQAALLAAALRRRKQRVQVFSFPDYATPVGRQIKRYLAGRQGFAPRVLHCLLSANRWEMLDEIRDAVSKNHTVIMNRYVQSNLVYGTANGLPLAWLEGLDAGLPRADLVIILDVTQKESFRRKAAGRDEFERDAGLSRRVCALYKKMARGRHWRIVDASGTKEEVHGQIIKLLARKAGA